MNWFKATRCTGDNGGIGEFHVEDSQGVEWLVRMIESKKNPGKLVYEKPIVCLNHNYNCGYELEGDLYDSVKALLTEESGQKNDT